MGVRGDLQLLERAWRMRWDTHDLKRLSIEAAASGLQSEDERIRMRAVALVVAMESQNQTDQHKAVDVDQSSRNRFLEVAKQLGIGSVIESVPAIGTNRGVECVVDVDSFNN